MLFKSLHQHFEIPSLSQTQSQNQHLVTSSTGDGGGAQALAALTTQSSQKPLLQLDGVNTIGESDNFDNDFEIGDLDLCQSMNDLLQSTQNSGNDTKKSTVTDTAGTSELSDLKSLLDAASCGNTGLEDFSTSPDQLSFSEDLLNEINLDKIQGKNDAGLNLELLIPEGGFSGFNTNEEKTDDYDESSYSSGGEWADGGSDLISEDNEDRLVKENQGLFQELICGKYKTFQSEQISEDDIIFSLSDMLSCINDYASVKNRAFMQVGVAPVVDILSYAINRTETIQGMVLKVVNKIVEGSPELMRLLAAAGGVPPFELFARGTTSTDILNDVVTFYDELYTLQRPVFFGNNGVSIVTYMLKTLVDKVEIALDCVLGILRIILRSLRDEKSRTLFDISHSYLREGLPEILAQITDAFITLGHSEYNEHIPEAFSLLSNIFFELSGTDNKVRICLCKKESLRCIIHIFSNVNRSALETRLAIAKTTENLAETTDNVAALRREGVLKALLEQITDSKIGILSETDTRARIYNTMQKSVKLDPTLNPELIKLGIVPLLCADVDIRPLDAIAVPFLILLLKNAKRRDAFSKCKLIDILIKLVSLESYAPTAMETIAWWIEKDTLHVKSRITQSKVISDFATAFISSSTWSNMLVSIISISKKSKAFAQKIGAIHDFMNCIMARLATSTPENILKLLDLIDVLYASASKKKDFSAEYNLVTSLNELKTTLASKVVVCRSLEKLLEKIK